MIGSPDPSQASGCKVQADIMVPLVGTVEEFVNQEQLIRAVAKKVFAEKGVAVPFRVGTMIEIPRAALMAKQIAAHAEFFSFGTNDLTQMTFGYSSFYSSRMNNNQLEDCIYLLL
eukprot:9404957-Pyramimonas_sp.AAC.2